MRTPLSFFLSLLLIVSFAYAPYSEAAVKSSPKGAFKETVRADELIASYAAATQGGEKIRILIMPGHEPDLGGAEFKGHYERELVVDIANKLATELRTDANFEVFVARGNEGWNNDFTYYFDKQGKKIQRFVDTNKKAMAKLEKRKKLTKNNAQADHNEARSDVALRLYGVNKWANENDVDLVLHLHLNDETSHGANTPGVHSGSAVYIPDSIYGNAKASRAIAEPVFRRLNSTNATSTFGLETSGVLEDRELIAIGAYNTSEVPSLLIEYGYIYEPRITGEGAQREVFTDFAFQTSQGVKDFFGSPVRPKFSTKVLPYQFVSDVLSTSTQKDVRGVYALQAALHSLGYYPGTEAALSVCPISGITNECMAEALKAFQAVKGLEQTGTFDPATRSALNNSFGLATPVVAPVPVVAQATPVTV
ncbi:MAG: N-acetylmuramoyl-L-alanine amidase, partial [Rectinemataceae bacterium]|nr:N-acetylmuramoyl-L-alanine amidase [Rectinemataceae bacterium]